jgi:hypothetical protein
MCGKRVSGIMQKIHVGQVTTQSQSSSKIREERKTHILIECNQTSSLLQQNARMTSCFMSCSSPVEERSMLVVLTPFKYPVNDRRLACCDDKYVYRCVGFHHHVHPHLALQVCCTNDFHSSTLQFLHLHALICDAWPPFNL